MPAKARASMTFGIVLLSAFSRSGTKRERMPRACFQSHPLISATFACRTRIGT